MSTTSCILSSEFPSMDLDYFDYIKCILDENSEDLNTCEEVYDAVGEILHGVADGTKNEDEIKQICEKLLIALKGDSEITENSKNAGYRTLSTPVHLGKIVEQTESERSMITSSLGGLAQRENPSVVDQKKLEKAEARLKQKQEKRENTDKVVKPVTLHNCEATAVQAIRKKDIKLDTKGSNKILDIKIENFDVAFGDKLLLQNAELTLVYGRRYGMVGRNGIGKSTLLKMISSGQLRIPSHISFLHVEQEVVGDDTLALDSVLECDTVREALLAEEKALTASPSEANEIRLSALYIELQNIEADKAPAKASKILAGLGFTPEMQRKPTREFSGGWRMRIALARALFSRPDLLLLDEPTNMLDMKAIIWLETYLQGWPTTLLVVSHDRRFLDTVATDIIHFHSRHLACYRGNYTNFVTTMTERLRCQQREYEAQVQARQHAQIFIDKFRFNAKRASLVQSRIKWLEKLPELQPVEKETAVVFHFPEVEPLSPPLLHLDNVSFAYSASGPTILKNVDLMVNMDARICIVGDNGSGKTTLLKILIGALEPISGLRHCHRNLVLGYFTQHHVDQLDMGISSVEMLAQRFPGKKSEEYRRQLGRFGITGDLALQSVATLSGGQKSRVAFAAMAMLNPHFLVLDEPTNHLDVETVEALGNAISEYKGGVVLVSHDQELIEMVCKELWVCRGGSVTSIPGGFKQYRKIVEEELAAQG